MAQYSRALVMTGAFVQSLKIVTFKKSEQIGQHNHWLCCKNQLRWQWQQESSCCFVITRDVILGQEWGRGSLAISKPILFSLQEWARGFQQSWIFTWHLSAVLYFLRHVSISVARKGGEREQTDAFFLPQIPYISRSPTSSNSTRNLKLFSWLKPISPHFLGLMNMGVRLSSPNGLVVPMTLHCSQLCCILRGWYPMPVR